MAKVIERDEQKLENTWDLTTIFESDEAFEAEYEKLESHLGDEEKFKGNINSAESLLEALELAKQAKAMGVPDAARLVADIERRL